jgi:5-methylcytosine-specific restriction enzyme subunit McrC
VEHILYVSEQHDKKKIEHLSNYLNSVLVDAPYMKMFYHNSNIACFHLRNINHEFFVDTNYFVGVDWIVEGKAAVYVEPKLNNEEQVDFLNMLLQSLSAPENLKHLDGLFHIDYDNLWIPIPEQKDHLSPILIVQFLKLVQSIVRKGLKKSYYRVSENLNGRIKGKILVGPQIKENVVNNRHTKTICNFQEYGFNTLENQFLKLVLKFVSSYLNQRHQFFDKEQNKHLGNILNYCFPYFEQVDILSQKHKKFQVEKNIFYKEYEEAIKIGRFILKRFSFNIDNASQSQTSTPPFWIDMSKLFELYVYGKLKKLFSKPGELTYHDNFKGGKQTDILVRAEGYKCVVDCKYKPRYENQEPSLADKRQLAGYARLKSVFNKLGISYDKIIPGLIIYSHQACDNKVEIEKLFSKNIEEYVEFYKLGISLPNVALSNP